MTRAEHTSTTAPAASERTQILTLLRAWIHQRPGLDPRNYGDLTSYRSESRSITRDLHDAETLLAYVERHDSITADMLRDGFRAFSGRLSLTDTPRGLRLDYCTGQYWPTEYRKAACAVLASAVWSWMRDECMPAVSGYRVESWGRYENGKRLVHRHPIGPLPEAESMLRHFGGSDYGHVVALHDGKSAGNYLRAAARREFGAAIARRWFN